MNIRLTILGNNSAIPGNDRHPTAQIIDIHDQLFLVDCGEGTQIQMQRYNIRRKRINYIFISHLHGDHYFGLIGLITSMGLMGRTLPLYIFAPEQLKEIIMLQLSVASITLPFDLFFEKLEPGKSQLLVETAYFKVEAFPVEHRIDCHGFVFSAKNKGRRILPEKCREYGVPSAFYHRLKEGDDYIRKDGEQIKNEWVTTDGPKEKSYAYCADTKYTLSFLKHIEKVDALYHESTYLHDLEERAADRFHSTAKQAAQLAKAAGAGRLLLGHFSSKYSDLTAFYEEASEIFPDVEISVEGTTYEI